MIHGAHADLVSIVTPCYNAAPFVADTIASVAAQRYPAIEHIVVDDASTDGSWDVIRRFEPEVHAERQPANLGAAAARNHGFARARGRFLMFLDADDVLGPDAVSELVDALRRDAGAIATCEWRRLVEGRGGWSARPAGMRVPADDDALFRGWIESRCFIPPCAILWPREVYEPLGGWDEALTVDDDTDLMFRALAAGARLVRAARGVAYYRQHRSQASLSQQLFSERRLASRRRVLDKLVTALDRHGRLPAYRAPLSVAYHRLALTAYQHGLPEFARASLGVGEQLGGRRALSRTMAGRLLARLVGLERKERVVQWLERRGIATAERRRLSGWRRSAGEEVAGAP